MYKIFILVIVLIVPFQYAEAKTTCRCYSRQGMGKSISREGDKCRNTAREFCINNPKKRKCFCNIGGKKVQRPCTAKNACAILARRAKHGKWLKSKGLDSYSQGMQEVEDTTAFLMRMSKRAAQIKAKALKKGKKLKKKLLKKKKKLKKPKKRKWKWHKPIKKKRDGTLG